MSNKFLALALLLTLGLTACGSKQDQDTGPRIVEGVNFVGVTVSDIEQSQQFYAAATGLEVAENINIDNSSTLNKLAKRDKVNVAGRLLKSVNSQLLYMQFAQPSEAALSAAKVEAHGPGIAHICYQVNKEVDTYGQLLANGATHMGAREMVQLNPRRPVEYAYARDHDETMFEIEHVDISKLDLPEPPKHNHRIRHVSLATPDIDRAVEFYSHLLQQSEPRRAGKWLKISGDKVDDVSGLSGSKLEMAWFQVRNLELEIFEYASHPTQLPAQPRAIDAKGYNMIVFDVSDLELAKTKFIEAGGEIVSDAEVLLGGEIVFGRDLDGNLIGLQKAALESVFSSKNFANDGT